jgi:ribokinase
MAKFLQNLLRAPEPQFTMALRKLEKASGYSGVDVALIGEILADAHAVMRKLGLDPADTTAYELYRALLAANPAQFKATHFVGLAIGDEIISFNARDIKANQGVSFESRSFDYMQQSLEKEIVQRYYRGSSLSKKIVEEFVRDAGLLEKTRAAETPIAKMPYILAIGDIVTDAFIKLRDDKARIDIDKKTGEKRLSMEFGSKPPYERVDIVQAVGNAANAAVAFARLGLNAGLMAYLGDDQPGKDSLAYLAKERINTSTVSVQKDMKSNYHYALRYGADRTILIKYEEYDYSWQAPPQEPDYIYLSMLSGAAWQLHVDTLAYLKKHPDVRLVFQPGTFHFEWGTKKLAGIYRRSYLVVLNREEAALVTGKNLKSIPELVSAMHALGPEVVVITDGPDGAYASRRGRIISMPNYPDPKPPLDRTGAGDAYAATITAALALDHTLETALSWAAINSMSVVQLLGAQAGLLTQQGIESYLKKAPATYHAEELET